MNERWLETRRGARVRVLEGGPPDGPPLVFLHGLTGLLDDTSPTFLDLPRSATGCTPPNFPATATPAVTELADPDSLREFFIGNARRLGTAGKILFPIPNRRLSKRLYRLTTETLIVWAEYDRLIPPVYASQWQARLARAHMVCLSAAGHMLPYGAAAGVGGQSPCLPGVNSAEPRRTVWICNVVQV